MIIEIEITYRLFLKLENETFSYDIIMIYFFQIYFKFLITYYSTLITKLHHRIMEMINEYK